MMTTFSSLSVMALAITLYMFVVRVGGEVGGLLIAPAFIISFLCLSFSGFRGRSSGFWSTNSDASEHGACRKM